MTNSIQLVVPLKDIERLRGFTSIEATRYYLQGVSFEIGAEGNVLAATDGYRLGVLRIEDSIINEPGIVRLSYKLPRLDSLQRKERQWLVIGTFGGEQLGLVVSFPVSASASDVAERAKVSAALAVFPRPLIDGAFPDWRRVVPAEIGKPIETFNPTYLADFLKASGQKSIAITAYGDKVGDPHVITVAGASDFIGVLMPMRGDPINSLPAWLAPSKQPKRKAA